MLDIKYASPQIAILSVLDAQGSPPGLVLEDNPALAAADVQLISNRQALTEMAAEHVAFTSGSVEPTPGDTISGATSGSTATYLGCLLTSGTWAGGDAAGTMWVSGASGAFQSENLDNDTTTQTNFATIGGDLTDRAVAAVGRTIAIGITVGESTCREGNIELRDTDPTEVYLESNGAFRTVGPTSAAFWMTGSISGIVTGTPTPTSTGNTNLTGFADDELNNRTITYEDGQSARITDYANTNGVVSHTTIANAVAAGTRFRID